MVNFQNLAKANQLFLVCLVILKNFGLAFCDPPYKLCSDDNRTTITRAYQDNLNTLHQYLSSNASVLKQYNTSTGDFASRVYGQYMCLGYVSSKTCRVCIDTALQDISLLCPNQSEAVVWEENCQLRYSNASFLTQLDVSSNIPLHNKKNATNPEEFRSLVNVTISNLIDKAAFDPSTNMYTTAHVVIPNDLVVLSDSNTLYALVQCSSDLSSDQCSTCLHVALANISACCYFSRGARVLSRSCYLRYELYSFYQGESDDRHSVRKINILTIIIPTVAAVVVIALLISLAVRRRARRDRSQDGGNLNNTDLRQSAFINMASIRVATNKFSYSNLLGQGSFGPVYKGILNDGKEVAVKRLLSGSEQGTEEFTNEVALIMKLQHKNLVRLIGFSIDGEEKLLVYEYMPNKSLDVILFDSRKRLRINWRERVNIINGIAKGMLYLHEDSRLRIIHRDLKPSNVLLDNDMNPKISDFGIARIFATSEGEANTARIVGTYGYMAPEYAMEGLYSTKSDIYSFGVILIEIITGRRNVSFQKSQRTPSLVTHAWQAWNEGNELGLMDPLLANSCCSDEFSRCMHIGLLCVQENAFDRPSMSSIVQMLKTDQAPTTLPEPERPAFTFRRLADQHDAHIYDISANGITISDIMPR